MRARRIIHALVLSAYFAGASVMAASASRTRMIEQAMEWACAELCYTTIKSTAVDTNVEERVASCVIGMREHGHQLRVVKRVVYWRNEIQQLFQIKKLRGPA